MNAERLNAIARILKPEVSNSVTHLKFLVNSLIARKDTPDAHQRFDKQIEGATVDLFEHCDNSVAETLPASSKQFLRDHGIWGLLGKSLKSDVESAMSRYRSSTDLAINSTSGIMDNVDRLDRALGYLINGFTYFSFGQDELAPGECEIGFVIPREAVNNHLYELGEEFEELNRILGPFAELAVGRRPPFEVRSIAASNFAVYVTTGCAIASAFAGAVVFVMNSYKNVLEIKKLRSELAERGGPADAVASIDNYADGIVETAIGDATRDLFRKFPLDGNEERRYELTAELKVSLTKVAKRIDEGYAIEVRAEPPSVDEPVKRRGR